MLRLNSVVVLMASRQLKDHLMRVVPLRKHVLTQSLAAVQMESLQLRAKEIRAVRNQIAPRHSSVAAQINIQLQRVKIMRDALSQQLCRQQPLKNRLFRYRQTLRALVILPRPRSQTPRLPLAPLLNSTAVPMARLLLRARTLLAAHSLVALRAVNNLNTVVALIGVLPLPALMAKAALRALANHSAAVQTMRLLLTAHREKAAALIQSLAAAPTTFGLHTGPTLRAASVRPLHTAVVQIRRLPHVGHNRRAVHVRLLHTVAVRTKSPLPEDPNLKAVHANQCSLVAVPTVFPLPRDRITRDATAPRQNSNAVRMVGHQLKDQTLKAAPVWRPSTAVVQMALQRLRMTSLAVAKMFKSHRRRLVAYLRSRVLAAISASSITLILLMAAVLDSGTAAVRAMAIVLRPRPIVRIRARNTPDSMFACCQRVPVLARATLRNGTSIQTAIVARSSNTADAMALTIASTV